MRTRPLLAALACGVLAAGVMVLPGTSAADDPPSAVATTDAADADAAAEEDDDAGPAFPLRASDDGASLVEADGTPFRYLADTAWLAPSRLDQDEVRTLLDRRVKQGFTAVQMSALAFLHLGDPANAYGDDPFVGGTDLSRPLVAGGRTTDPDSPDYDYWDHVAWIVGEAGRRGLALTLVPSWYGYGGEDWRSHVTTANAAVYGRFLGRRLGEHENLVWMLGGDNNPVGDTARMPEGGDTSDKTAATNAMGEALRAAESVRHLMTYHAKRRVSSFEHFEGQTWHTLASAYSDERTAAHVAASSGRGLPVVVTEAWYDARPWSPVLDHRRLRAQAWSAVVGGAGFAYGHEHVWDLDAAWTSSIKDPSAYDVGRICAVLTGLGQVTPARSVLAAGASGESDVDRAVTGRAGSTAITYVPSPRPVTVDLAALGGRRVRLTWVEPATGARRSAGSHEASGTEQLSWPGWADAVLLMTRSPRVEDAAPELPGCDHHARQRATGGAAPAE